MSLQILLLCLFLQITEILMCVQLNTVEGLSQKYKVHHKHYVTFGTEEISYGLFLSYHINRNLARKKFTNS